MKFPSENCLKAFLNDEPFYATKDCFCLGKTLTDAGRVVRKLMDDTRTEAKERKGNVAVDYGCSEQSK